MALERAVRGDMSRSISQKRQPFRQLLEPKVLGQYLWLIERFGQHVVQRIFAPGPPKFAKARVQQFFEADWIASNGRLVQRGLEGTKLLEQLHIHSRLQVA